MQAYGDLFDSNTTVYVYPFKSEHSCSTAQTFSPEPQLKDLYQYLLDSDFIADITDCDDVDTSLHSEEVRDLLRKNDSRWEQLVPGPVKDLIKHKKLFGYTE